MPDPSDRLVIALRTGAPGAVRQAYEVHHVTLFGFLVRLCGNRDLAADLFQNTWLKLARHAPRLSPETQLKAWLFTVARNEYRSYRRWQFLDLSRIFTLAMARRDEVVAPPSGTDASLEAALTQLPRADRELLLLIYVEGIDSEQASTILGISGEALRQRLSRARKKLENLLMALDSPLESPHSKGKETSYGPAI